MPTEQNKVCEAVPNNEMSEARAKRAKLISDLKAECEELAQRIEKCQKFVLKVQAHGERGNYIAWCEKQLSSMQCYHEALSYRINILQSFGGENIVTTLGKIYQR